MGILHRFAGCECILELRARIEALEEGSTEQAESNRFCTDAIVARIEALEAAQQPADQVRGATEMVAPATEESSATAPPAPAAELVPVPVSERLPGPEDCDDQGRCWWLDRPLKNGPDHWMLRRQDDGSLIPFIAWAPHWAIRCRRRGPMADLSPAAQAAWEAFNEVAERVGVFEDYGDALGAAIRALAKQIPEPHWSKHDEVHQHIDDLRAELLAIAAELEGQR
jgi:hypothetical protein